MSKIQRSLGRPGAVRMGLSRTPLFSLLFGALLATPALGGPLGPDELKTKIASLAGKPAEVEGKFRECWGDRYVSVMTSDLKLYLPASGALKKNAPENLDSFGKKLKNKSSNILIKGVVVDNRSGAFPKRNRYFFEAREVRRIADDIPRFEEKLRARRSRNMKDFQGIHEVAAEARGWAKRYKNSDLETWTLEQDRLGLKIHGEQISGTKPEPWIAFAREYVSRLGDRSSAIGVLDKVYKGLKDGGPRRRVEGELKSLGGYFFQGSWVTYAAYKTAEGFLKRTIDGKELWIPQRRAELLDQVAGHKAADDLVDLDPEYERNAAAGKISKGMRRFHLTGLKRGNKSLGFPTFVDRIRIKRPGRKEPIIYDQWMYSGDRRYYFYNDRLFAWFINNEPFPKK